MTAESLKGGEGCDHMLRGDKAITQNRKGRMEKEEGCRWVKSLPVPAGLRDLEASSATFKVGSTFYFEKKVKLSFLCEMMLFGRDR